MQLLKDKESYLMLFVLQSPGMYYTLNLVPRAFPFGNEVAKNYTHNSVLVLTYTTD